MEWKLLTLPSEGPLATLFSSSVSMLSQSQLTSESLERQVELFLETLTDWEVPTSMSNVAMNKELALELKEKGNTLFKENNLMQAIATYTQSLKQLSEHDDEYSIVLANRSAALDSAGFYCSAIRDIDTAMRHGYPRKLQFKILNRKGHALLKLRQFKSSREAFQSCLNMIGKSEFSTKARDQFRAKVQKQMTVFNVSKTIEDVHEEDVVNNREEMKMEKKELGDVLVSQKPLAIVSHTFRPLSSSTSSLTFCEHTWMPLISPLPCLHGTDAMFLSEEVRRESEEHGLHKYEWPIWHFVHHQLPPMAKLAFRLLLKLHLDNGVSFEFDSLHLFDTETNRKKSQLTFLAALLLRALSVVNVQVDSETVLKAIITVIKRSVLVKSLSLEFEAEVIADVNFGLDPVALAIYPNFENSFNLPIIEALSESFNCLQLFSNWCGRQLVVCKTLGLENGLKVLYDPNLSLESSNENDESTQPFIILKCQASPKCHLSFPLREHPNKQVIKCPQCGSVTNIFPRLKRIQEIKKSAQNLQNVNLEKAKEQIPLLLSQGRTLIRAWDEIVERPYAEIEMLQQLMLKLILLQQWIKQRKWRKRHL